jgi:predicted dehydrogenase
MQSNHKFDFVILGAGGRGTTFADWIKLHPEAGRVVGVAEPDPGRRQHIARPHQIPEDKQFERWEDLLDQPKFADVVINTLQDRLHAPSAIKAMKQGYDMLLEKPMATTLSECVEIDRVCRAENRVVLICHSLRYNPFYVAVKKFLAEGEIGRLVSFDQLESVDPVHHAHSYVRGPWARESESTFMLMAKSCHDIDILAWLADKPCTKVSSFGSLSYFTKENAPMGSPKRCTDGCPAEAQCPYSAVKVYADRENDFWARVARLNHLSQEQKYEALKNDPVGRCVFHCDNDVVDHQVVNFEFEEGTTGTFTMTAFALPMGRRIRLHGTHGYIQGDVDSGRIELWRFGEKQPRQIHIPRDLNSGGHSDDQVMVGFLDALQAGDPSRVLTSTAESLKTHRIVFAAEQSRIEGRTVSLSKFTLGE